MYQCVFPRVITQALVARNGDIASAYIIAFFFSLLSWTVKKCFPSFGGLLKVE